MTKHSDRQLSVKHNAFAMVSLMSERMVCSRSPSPSQPMSKNIDTRVICDRRRSMIPIP